MIKRSTARRWVFEVCNLSTGVYNKGYHSGYDSGISTGEMKKARETAYKLQDMKMPVEQISTAVEFPLDTIQEWLAEREEMLVK